MDKKFVTKSAKEVWDKCLEIIQDIVDPQHYQTWFTPIKPVGLKDNNILLIEVPSQFFYEYLEEHYLNLLAKTVKQQLGKEGRLEYKIVVDSGGGRSVNLPGGAAKTFNSNEANFPLVVDNPVKNPFIIPGLKRVQIDSQLTLTHVFDSFIEGDCNRVARRAGLTIAKQPGSNSFNPLVVSGGVGLGKTHLVQAIGNETKKINPNKIVLYVSSEKFINQFTDHARTGSINDFIHFYQLIDVLIVDDVQFFSKGEKTQDAFFTIFNHLHQSGKQLILTCDRLPKDLEGLQDRLLSRFRWGLNADLQVPDYETRIEILKRKMRDDGMELEDDIVKYIAHNVATNVRELEGSLIALLAQSSLNRKEIDLNLAKAVLRNFIKTSTKEVTIEMIQTMVCERLNVPYATLVQKTRKHEVVQARQITMHLAKEFTKHSLKTIGGHFGGRDHTTVIHSCKTVKNLMETDTDFKDLVVELTQKVHLATM